MNEEIDLDIWLDDKRKKDIQEFKLKHPAQYACIKELGRKQGAVEVKEKYRNRLNELKSDIEMLKAENKELEEKLKACEDEVYILEGKE